MGDIVIFVMQPTTVIKFVYERYVLIHHIRSTVTGVGQFNAPYYVKYCWLSFGFNDGIPFLPVTDIMQLT